MCVTLFVCTSNSNRHVELIATSRFCVVSLLRNASANPSAEPPAPPCANANIGMRLPSVEELVASANLDGGLAEALRREDISVALLLKSSLAERREVLRALDVSFGNLLTLNRVLEAIRQDKIKAVDAGTADDDDDDDDDTDGQSQADEGSDGEEEEEEEEEEGSGPVAPARALPERPSISVPLEPSLRQRLEAAAMLLRGATPATWRALQAHLSNVLEHPERAAYRTIQLSNPVFHERVWGVPGGASLLRAAGFTEGTLAGGSHAVLRLPPSSVVEPMVAAKEIVDQLLGACAPAPSCSATRGANGGSHGSAGSPTAAQAQCTPAAATAAGGGCGDGKSPSSCAPFCVPMGVTAAAARPLDAMACAASAAPSAAQCAAMHRRAAQSVMTTSGLLEGAHTQTWDAALASMHGGLRLESLSDEEIRTPHASSSCAGCLLLHQIIPPPPLMLHASLSLSFLSPRVGRSSFFAPTCALAACLLLSLLLSLLVVLQSPVARTLHASCTPHASCTAHRAVERPAPRATLRRL